MVGALERIILSELHKKAMAENMDLNNFEDFTKFAAKLDQVALQAQKMVTSLMDSVSCGCGKKRKPPVDTRPNPTSMVADPKLEKMEPIIEIVEEE